MSVAYGILIGRFQIPHIGHIELIRDVLTKCNHLILFIGSSFLDDTILRTKKNPFTFTERCTMLSVCFTQDELEKISFIALSDYPDDNDWFKAINSVTNAINYKNESVGIFGYVKDDTSYYLKCFPQYQYLVLSNCFHDGLSSTPIRERFLLTGLIDQSVLHPNVVEYLRSIDRDAINACIQN